MKKTTPTLVIEKLIDLELIFKLKADISRFKKKQELNKVQSSQAA